jgi:hypothetical protein
MTTPTQSFGSHSSRRRDLLQRSGALACAGLWGSCNPPSPSSSPGTAGLSLEAILASTKDGRLDLAGLPYRQDDPRWARDLMWNREQVLQVAIEHNGLSPQDAAALMRAFPDGNTIANEGCQLTCMAMVLQMLVPDIDEPWTPALLNELAQLFFYYTPSGLALATLYGDFVSDASEGAVQLALKDEYLPAVGRWPRVTASKSPLVRAYRRLPPQKRTSFVVMLKTGTYDDTVASHFCLLHPEDEGGPHDDNPLILDPAQPRTDNGPWRLLDSASYITSDPDIAAAWQSAAIGPQDLAGVWVFVRKDEATGQRVLAPLVAAWAEELISD